MISIFHSYMMKMKKKELPFYDVSKKKIIFLLSFLMMFWKDELHWLIHNNIFSVRFASTGDGPDGVGLAIIMDQVVWGIAREPEGKGKIRDALLLSLALIYWTLNSNNFGLVA